MKYNYTKNLSLLSILTFVVTVAISFKCSTAEKSKDDLTEYKLKGKVKFFKEFSYEAINSFGNLEKGKRVRENLYENDLYVVFNEKGEQTRKLSPEERRILLFHPATIHNRDNTLQFNGVTFK